MHPLILKSLCAAVLIGLLVSCAEMRTPPDRQELRGVWITNIDSDVMFDRAKTAEAMQFLSDRGFNIVFPGGLERRLHPVPQRGHGPVFR